MCLVGRWRERENSWGPTIFSLGPPNYNLSKIERKQERNFCACERIFGLWCFATRSSFFFSFSTLPTSFIHFGLLFIFFYFIFILVSSCFPFYASIFFSFFFTSFLFLFLFFKKNLFTRFCILFLLLSPFFFFLKL